MTIELVDTIDVVADTALVTFGAGGDGALGTALDGDADEFYILDGVWIPHANTGTFLDLEFNGINTATSSQVYTVVSGGAISAFRRRPGIFLSMTQMASQPVASFTASIWPLTGFQERTMFVRGTSLSGAQLPSTQRSGGQWQHNTANITSLVVACRTADGIRSGSRFRLFKRITPTLSISYPTTLSEIGTMMGYQDPNHAWRLDNITSCPDFGAGAALGPAGSPTLVPSVAPIGDGVAFSVNSGDDMAAGDTTTMDVTTGDFMVLALFTWQTYGGGRSFSGKLQGPGYYLHSVNDGILRGDVDGNFVVSTLSTYRDGESVIAAYGRRSGIPFLVTDREPLQTTSIRATSLSNADAFAVGNGAGQLSQGFTGYLNVGWNATLSSLPTQAQLQALKAAIGL